MQGVLLLLELAILYFLSRALTKRLFQLFFLLFRSRTLAVTLLTLIQFPGTVVHELAHLFTAEVLGVRTGKLSLVPEDIRETYITTGSVMVGKSDPFRRHAIGLAPIFVGMIVLTALSGLISDWTNVTNWRQWTNWVVFYFLFAVSNSMFSSKEDLKGFIPFAIVLGIFIGFFYYLGLRIGITDSLADIASRIVEQLATSLGIVLGVNLVLLLLAVMELWIVQKITRLRIRQA